MSQELIGKMATFMAAGDWAGVAEVAAKLASLSATDSSDGDAKTRKVKAKEKPEKDRPTSSNRFVDDKTLEKQHIQADKKWLKGAKPTGRRPASNREPVQVFCPKCNKAHMITPAIASLRQGMDSGVVCPSCLRGKGGRG